MKADEIIQILDNAEKMNYQNYILNNILLVKGLGLLNM